MSSKRKAATATVNGVDNPDLKKRKLVVAESLEETTTAGLQFIIQIRQARDKRGHLISTHFLRLPDKKEIPEYYEAIVLPIALDTIEGKLNRREYSTLSTLESDFKRMVSNAKSFNERQSEIFSDAEKIRKMVCNHMMKINPAYKDGSGYVPAPTPLPTDSQNGIKLGKKEDDTEIDADADGETDPEGDVSKETIEKPRRSVTLHGPSAEKELNRRRASSTPAVQDAADAGESFEGNTFQQAQEKIITELIQLKGEDGQVISVPFQNLPSRELRDYYRVIKHPVCLKGMQKQVRGVKGRDKPTGTSLFKSWQAFEEEARNIWNNARIYNEDGSEISDLAAELEAYFNRRMIEAKEAVAEPIQPKVKLRMPVKTPEPPPKITLRFGQKYSHDVTNGVAIDSEALKRQQDLVKAGANGHTAASANGTPSHRNLFGGSGAISGSTVSQLARDGRSDSAGSRPDSTNGVKAETTHVQSPALASATIRNANTASNEAAQSPHVGASTMPPPASTTPRLPSGSPHPQSNHNTYNHHTNNPLESRWRPPGKDNADALMTNLTIATHPGLKINRHFHLDIPPSPIATQQSITINLPATHWSLQLTPTLAPLLTHRQSKLVVMLNCQQRINSTPQKAEDTDPKRPLYDIRVMPGVNRIDVELVAGPPRGAPKVGLGQDWEKESITLFVNVLR